MERRCVVLYFNKLSYPLIHFLRNCEGDRSIRKKKGAWFLSREGGIIEGKIFCIIGPNALQCNESTLIEKILPVLTFGLLSSKKEVESGYGEDSRDDDNNTQDINPRTLVSANATRF